MKSIVNNRTEFLNAVKKLLPKNPLCLEIGTYNGEFAKNMYDILSPKELYVMDPFKDVPKQLTGFTKTERYDGGHKILYSDQSTLENLKRINEEGIKKGVVRIDENLSFNAVDNYDDDYFDFIYIDSCHLYECVKFDMENYYPKLKSGGFLAGHDYGDFGVTDAVDEFCKKHNSDIILLCSFQGDWMLSEKP